jgi:hypothetical protein
LLEEFKGAFEDFRKSLGDVDVKYKQEKTDF